MYSSPQNRVLAALAFTLAVLALPWRPAAPPAAAVDRLLARMNERLAVMPDVARWKWNMRRPITDPPRERALLDDVARRGAARGLDPAFVRRFFAAQIDAAKEMQQAAIARWTADGGPVVPVRDLSSLRMRIDQINSALLDELPAVTAAGRPRARRTVPGAIPPPADGPRCHRPGADDRGAPQW
ncbi:MAG: gamma subclass chorismate mutase AroQ [Gemmataceae bacterium]